MKSDNFLLRRRRAIAWMHAWLECLSERRPVSIIKTERMLQGWLL